MKKLRLFTLLALISMLALFTLVGCENQDTVASVSLKNYDSDTVIEVTGGDFDYNAYTLVVVYKSGLTKELPLTAQMIEESDLLKLYQVGEHDITVNYGNGQCSFKVSVKRNTFGELSFPENNVFTYNGKAHTVEVDGDIPANAVINYIGGNSFVNVGTYDVTAVVSCEGYVTQKLSTTVKIEKAKYDMSGVKLESKEVVYDGKAHSVAISGTLPKGVSSPSYTIDGKAGSSATEVGEYKIKASFTSNDNNYEAIPDMEATLKITPAEYSIKGLDIVFKSESGEVISNATKIYDGKSITFDLNDYGKLTKNISVSFTVYDKDGKVISTSNKETKISVVGVYTVKVEFTMADSKNYKPIEPIVRTFEVLKAEHPQIENVHFLSSQVSYTGEGHSILIDGKLPSGVAVSYEYYKDGVLIVDGEGKPVKSVADVGRYTVKAIFTHTDANLDEIAPLSAVLNITVATVDISHLAIELKGTTVYDGTEKSVTISGEIPKDIEAAVSFISNGKILVNSDGSYVTSVIDPGDYAVSVRFVSTNVNYEVKDTLEYTFRVEQAVIMLEGIEYDRAEEYTYSAEAHNPTVKSETVPDKITVTEELFSVDSRGNRTAVTSAVDAGKYVKVFTATPNDPIRYRLLVSGVTEWEFEILPQTLDVSGINISAESFTYNGSAQSPELTGVSELVNVDSTELYVHNEIWPIEQAINAGRYRLEVSLSTKSSNYTLSTDKRVFAFEIQAVVIDVSNLEFDSTAFEYDGKAHLPTFVEFPEHVQMSGNSFILNSINDDEVYVEEAVKAGKYRYYVWLGAESLNYTLSGDTEYIVDFEIKVDGIVIADFSTLPEIIEIPYDEKFSNGYYYEEDDPIFAQSIINAMLGENSNFAECSVGRIKNVETGGFLYTNAPVLKNAVYEVKIYLEIKPEADGTDKYVFFYLDEYYSAKEIYVRVKLV